MPILVACPCGKKLKVRDELAGKKVKCPGCGGGVEVELIAEVVEEAPARPQPPPIAKSSPDEPEAKPASFWNCRRQFTNGLLVITDDALWFNKLADKELKRAKKLLADGEDPADALEENDTRFRLAFDDISEIKFNKKLAQMQVEFPGADEKETTDLYFDDHATRDEAFKELRRRLGSDWEYKRRDLNRFQATFAPLAVIGGLILVFGFFVFLAWAFQQPSDGGPRVVRTTIWGIIVAYTVGWLGPLWTGAIGGVGIVFAVAWMFVRIADPPIEISLKPRTAKSSAKDDDHEEDDDEERRPRKRRRREDDD